MRTHTQDADELSLRPKSARIEDEPTLAAQAMASGRTAALDTASLLHLQRAVGNAGVASALEEDSSPVHGVVGSGGSPLAPDVRDEMETRLGHDFGDVRVHTDSAAESS